MLNAECRQIVDDIIPALYPDKDTEVFLDMGRQRIISHAAVDLYVLTEGPCAIKIRADKLTNFLRQQADTAGVGDLRLSGGIYYQFVDACMVALRE